MTLYGFVQGPAGGYGHFATGLLWKKLRNQIILHLLRFTWQLVPIKYCTIFSYLFIFYLSIYSWCLGYKGKKLQKFPWWNKLFHKLISKIIYLIGFKLAIQFSLVQILHPDPLKKFIRVIFRVHRYYSLGIGRSVNLYYQDFQVFLVSCYWWFSLKSNL